MRSSTHMITGDLGDVALFGLSVSAAQGSFPNRGRYRVPVQLGKLAAEHYG
jgi:hypothetical protein